MVAHIANQYYDQESIGKCARDISYLIPAFVFTIKWYKMHTHCASPRPVTQYHRTNRLISFHFIVLTWNCSSF